MRSRWGQLFQVLHGPMIDEEGVTRESNLLQRDTPSVEFQALDL
jgi:hypothetical protein